MRLLDYILGVRRIFFYFMLHSPSPRRLGSPPSPLLFSMVSSGSDSDSGWWNIKQRRRFWRGKLYREVIHAFRRAASPPRPNGRRSSRPACCVHRAPPGVELPLAQVALRDEGDPAEMTWLTRGSPRVRGGTGRGGPHGGRPRVGEGSGGRGVVEGRRQQQRRRRRRGLSQGLGSLRGRGFLIFECQISFKKM
jgi:hypothetical protein